MGREIPGLAELRVILDGGLRFRPAGRLFCAAVGFRERGQPGEESPARSWRAAANAELDAGELKVNAVYEYGLFDHAWRDPAGVVDGSSARRAEQRRLDGREDDFPAARHERCAI